jgi:hypothetical protein
MIFLCVIGSWYDGTHAHPPHSGERDVFGLHYFTCLVDPTNGYAATLTAFWTHLSSS